MSDGRRWLLAGVAILAFVAIAVGLYAVGARKHLIGARGELLSATPTPGQQAQSYERLRASAQGQLEVALEGAFPRGVIGEIPVEGQTPIEMARNYLDEYEGFYLQRDPNLELHLLRSSADSVVFYQT